MAPYRRGPLTPPRMLLRIVAKATTGALLVACNSETPGFTGFIAYCAPDDPCAGDSTDAGGDASDAADAMTADASGPGATDATTD